MQMESLEYRESQRTWAYRHVVDSYPLHCLSGNIIHMNSFILPRGPPSGPLPHPSPYAYSLLSFWAREVQLSELGPGNRCTGMPTPLRLLALGAPFMGIAPPGRPRRT